MYICDRECVNHRPTKFGMGNHYGLLYRSYCMAPNFPSMYI